MNEQRTDKLIDQNFLDLPPYIWVLGFLAVVLALAVCGLWTLYLTQGQFAADVPTPTIIIWTVTPSPAPTTNPSPAPTRTAEIVPTVSPNIAVGGYVRVTGTGGAGLSLREGPGPGYARQDVAPEGRVFLVVEGPASADGFQWWKVQDPENRAQEWWAAGNFLEPAEQP